MITNLIETPANIMDDKILENILPPKGAILADKGFDINDVKNYLKKGTFIL